MSSHLSTVAKAQPITTSLPVRSGFLQRKCACGGTPGPSGECEACRKKRQGTLQRAALDMRTVPAVPPIVHDVLRSPGQPLDQGTRSFMEGRFGHDFSQVRVHTDSQAARSTQSVNALAYTVGRHIAFDAGQYQPNTESGRRLMAHELAHVIQQSASGETPGYDLRIAGNDSAEHEAERIGATIEHGPAAFPGNVQQNPVLQRRVVPRPCEKLGNCPPLPPSSPIPSCSGLANDYVMVTLAREYVRTELDPSLSLGVSSIDCLAIFGACTIEFDSGVAVKTSVLLLDPSMSPSGADGRVFIEEILPPSGKSPVAPRKRLGPRCSYDVGCPLPGQLKWTFNNCRQLGPLGPGDFPTPSGDERIA